MGLGMVVLGEGGLSFSGIECILWRGWGRFRRDWSWGLLYYGLSCPFGQHSCYRGGGVPSFGGGGSVWVLSGDFIFIWAQVFSRDGSDSLLVELV